MGLEAKCVARYKGQAVEGRLQLESAELVFRGAELRLKIATAGMTAVTATPDSLVIVWGEDKAEFSLGPASGKWADKILNPPSLLAKLGIKPELKVSIQGELPEDFVQSIPAEPLRVNTDIILFSLAGPKDLEKIPTLLTKLSERGALWLIYAKGGKPLREAQVRRAALGAGLKDVKVASFSATLTATKWVRPINQTSKVPENQSR